MWKQFFSPQYDFWCLQIKIFTMSKIAEREKQKQHQENFPLLFQQESFHNFKEKVFCLKFC
jgi:hypothetical protein